MESDSLARRKLGNDLHCFNNQLVKISVLCEAVACQFNGGGDISEMLTELKSVTESAVRSGRQLVDAVVDSDERLPQIDKE